jgi:hypothetical protein
MVAMQILIIRIEDPLEQGGAFPVRGLSVSARAWGGDSPGHPT